MLEAPRGAPDFADVYARQIEAFLACCRSGLASPTAAAGLAAAALIDECRARRRLMTMGWLSPDEQGAAARHAGVTS